MWLHTFLSYHFNFDLLRFEVVSARHISPDTSQRVILPLPTVVILSILQYQMILTFPYAFILNLNFIDF